jgi:hypothetical protein
MLKVICIKYSELTDKLGKEEDRTGQIRQEQSEKGNNKSKQGRTKTIMANTSNM